MRLQVGGWEQVAMSTTRGEPLGWARVTTPVVGTPRHPAKTIQSHLVGSVCVCAKFKYKLAQFVG